MNKQDYVFNVILMVVLKVVYYQINAPIVLIKILLLSIPMIKMDKNHIYVFHATYKIVSIVFGKNIAIIVIHLQ